MAERWKTTKATAKEFGRSLANRLNGNYLRNLRAFRQEHNRARLPYPTVRKRVGDDFCEIYQIPREKLQEVFDLVWAWEGHARFVVGKSGVVPFTDGKRHRYSSAKIIRFRGYNYLVPPMFFKTGADAMGWGIHYDLYLEARKKPVLNFGVDLV